MWIKHIKIMILHQMLDDASLKFFEKPKIKSGTHVAKDFLSEELGRLQQP